MTTAQLALPQDWLLRGSLCTAFAKGLNHNVFYGRPMCHPVSECLKRADIHPVGVIGHNGVVRLKKRSGPKSGATNVAGLPVAQFERGRIASLYVFLDPNGA